MANDDAKAVVTAFIEALNSRDLDALDRLVAPDVVRHSRATPGVVVSKRTELRAFLEADFATFPDALQEVRLMLAEGPYVSALVTLSGTQDGPLGPFPPSGRQATTEFIAILRVESGRIAEMWVEWDNLTLLGQLGHGPLAT